MAGIDPELRRKIEEHLARQAMKEFNTNHLDNPLLGWPPDPEDPIKTMAITSMPVTTAPVPERILPAVGRRFKLSPHAQQPIQLGRPMYLPAVTLHTDVVRRMRERVGLDIFINQQSGVMYAHKATLRWRCP